MTLAQVTAYSRPSWVPPNQLGVCLSVNGKNVSSGDDYKKRVGLVEPGTPMDVVIRRGRRILTLRIDREDKP